MAGLLRIEIMFIWNYQKKMLRLKYLPIFLLFLFLGSSTAYAAPKFVGHWSWLQHTTRINGHMSLCTGDLDVRRDGTFHIWNACKENESNCYSIVEVEGFWEVMGRGLFRAYLGDYFYDVILSNNAAFFSLMSVADEDDQGNFEIGMMLKGVRIDPLKEFYYRRECGI